MFGCTKETLRSAGGHPLFLYDTQLATYTVDDTFDHSAAEGFIKIYGLPLKTFHKINKSNKGRTRTVEEEEVIRNQ